MATEVTQIARGGPGAGEPFRDRDEIHAPRHGPSQSFAFLETSIDPISKKAVVKRVPHIQTLVDLKALLRVDECRSLDEKQKVLQLAHLLDACLHLDPAQRLRPEEALEHPFLLGRTKC